MIPVSKTFTSGLTFTDTTNGALIATVIDSYSGTIPFPADWVIMVTALPALGVLKKSDGTAIAAFNTLTTAEFLAIKFFPPVNSTGSTTFSYKFFNANTSEMSNEGIVTLVYDTHVLTAEEIAAADKARMARIVTDLQAGVQVPDDDSIFYTLGGNSAREKAVMDVLNAGHGYQELKALSASNTALGLTDAMIMRALAIFFTLTDTARYESERALQLITSYSILNEFAVFLAGQNITVPDVKLSVASFRANQQVFAAAKAWAAQRV